MVDATIQILIEANDKISKQLSSIEKNIEKFGNANQRASDKMANSWQKGTNSLLAIGNVAASVDNIFSSLTNLEIRLENATERLSNAQDRLLDSQINLTRANQDLEKIQKSYDFVLKNNLQNTEFGIGILDAYENASRKVEDAQKAEERATRGLTIAENGLKKAQNQVLGTYIGIGIQSVSLIQSLPVLISSMGAFGVVAAGVAAAVGVLFLASKDNIEVQETLRGIWERLKPALNEILISLGELVTELWPILQPVLIFMAELFIGVAEAIRDIIRAIKEVIGWIKDLIDWINKIDFGKVNTDAFKVGGGTGRASKTLRRATSVNDAIIKPNGQIIKTHPMDTIIATKNPGGVIVYIDNIYGVNAKDISRELKNELYSKTSF